MPQAWSPREVDLIVEDYFSMLSAEIRGESYNKTEHRRKLLPQLDGRSDASVEFKHRNISAVVGLLGVPYIFGYKPARNFQRTVLPDAVQTYLQAHPEIGDMLRTDVESEIDVPSVEHILSILESPPEHDPTEVTADAVAEVLPSFGLQTDYLQREAENQKVGLAGEKLVINYEKARLEHEGQASLADKIEHTSVEVGDGAGFDIHSYETSGADRFIEAKTTRYGKETPFFVTPNELRFSDTHSRDYWLYRVFGLKYSPRLYCVNGPLKTEFQLKPKLYLATA